MCVCVSDQELVAYKITNTPLYDIASVKGLSSETIIFAAMTQLTFDLVVFNFGEA